MSPARAAGPRVLRRGPSTTVASVSVSFESVRAALTKAVAAAPAASAVTPGARRTRAVTKELALIASAAWCGTQTSAALGSESEKPGGIAPTIV